MHTLPKTLVSLAFALLLGSHASAQETATDAPIKSNPGPVDKVAKAAAKGVERGAEATARGVERGAEATARGVERGASATGRAANKVADKIGGGSSSESAKSPASVPVTDK
jgi:hypothetical protein